MPVDDSDHKFALLDARDDARADTYDDISALLMADALDAFRDGKDEIADNLRERAKSCTEAAAKIRHEKLVRRANINSVF